MRAQSPSVPYDGRYRQPFTAHFNDLRPGLYRFSGLFCFVGSILTSKSLMMNQLKDGPISLLLVQLAAVSVLHFTLLASGVATWAPWVRLHPKMQVNAIRFLTTIATACGYLICAYKTMRFSGSLATAALLLSLQWKWCNNAPGRITTNPIFSVTRWLVFLFGFALVIIWDFRLNVTSRDMSIASLLLSYILAVVLCYLRRSQVSRESLSSGASFWPLLMLPIIGLVVFLDETPRELVHGFTNLACMLLAVNVLLTITAYVLLIASPAAQYHVVEYNLGSSNTFRMSALAGAISLGSWLIPGQPALLSPWQFVGYTVALMACSRGDGDQDAQQPSQTGPKYDCLVSLEDQTQNATCPQFTHAPQIQQSVGFVSYVNLVDLSRTAWTPRICVIIVWLLFGYASISTEPRKFDYSAAHLDDSFNPAYDLDIVVAAYDRPGVELARNIEDLLNLPNLQSLESRIIVYDKGINSTRLSENLRRLLPNTTLSVNALDNEGREGGTYLHHITSHWEKLARHTLFIQEQPHDFWLLRQRISDYYAEETGFMSLSYEGKLWKQCQQLEAEHWPSITGSISRVLDMVHPGEGNDCLDLVLTYRGQFIASAARIRGNGKRLYTELSTELLDVNSWMHAPPYTQSPWAGSPDSLVNPTFGYTLERLWGVIMQCSNENLAYRSPSLLASYIRSVWFGQTFPLADVQCLDTAS